MKKIKNIQPITEATKWREDFPVDEVKEHFIERREFTKFLLLISGSFVMGQVYIAYQNIFRKSSKLLPLKKIVSVNDLKVNDFIAFQYPDKNDSCFLIRLEQSKFVAFSSKCTHLMCPVIPKMEEKKFHCPCHSGYFDIATGDVLAGPPQRGLERVKLKFVGNDIYAEGMVT
jgi:Rieske Fe-S protein